MRLRAISIVFLLTAFVVALAFAQTKKPLTNADVLQMAKAGFQESMAVKAIEANETNFDVSVQALMDLKNAGVSQAVIEAMLSAEAKKRTAPASGTKNAEDGHQVGPVRSQTGAVGSGNARNEDPWPTEVSGMPREVGAYYKQPDGKFVELFGKPIVATSTGGFIKMGLTMGLSKIRSRGQLPGKHAQLQVTERDPVFYIYMPEDQTPEAVSIVRMEEKGNRREFEVGSAGGASASSKSGLDVKKVHQIVIERLAHRLFRVMPDRELETGEYGFIGQFTLTAVGMAGAGERIYDFGIVKKRK